MSETVVKYYIAAIPFYSKVFLLKKIRRQEIPAALNYQI
jgi:hypothetical protein